MALVSRSLARLREDLDAYLPPAVIEAAAVAAGHRWRQRKLGPVMAVHLCLVQTLWFNTAIEHLRRLSGFPFAASAFCVARMRLPLEALQNLLLESSRTLRDAHADAGRWHGLRAFLVDGSSTITPDTPESTAAFGQPKGCKPGCGFPVPKLLGLFDAFTGMVVQLLAFPLYTHEQSKVWQLHGHLGPGDLIVGDRGFCSFVHLALLQARGVAAVFRMHQRQNVDFDHDGKTKSRSTLLRRIGPRDQVVRWRRPAQVPRWMTAAQWERLPEWLEIRELQYTIHADGRRTRVVTIATTLTDEQRYTRDAIAALYGVRWEVETHFAELKTTLKMRKLKSKTPDGIRKELAAYCLVYNLVRSIMVKAAKQQHTTPDRISFIDTVRWLLTADPGEPIPKLVVNRRRNRHEPRVIKDLQDTYTKMSRPRAELKTELAHEDELK